MAICKNCGQQIPDGVRFCPNCGTQVDVIQNSQVAQDMQNIKDVQNNDSNNEHSEESMENAAPVTGSYNAGTAAAAGTTPPQPQPYSQPYLQQGMPQPYSQQGMPQPYPQQNYQQPQQGMPQPYTQQNYQQPRQGVPQPYSQQGMPQQIPTPAKKNHLPLILGICGGVLALIIILIIVIMNIPDVSKSDPALGLWNNGTVSIYGMNESVSDVFPDGFTIELLQSGQCKVNVDGKSGNGKWSYNDDGSIDISDSGLGDQSLTATLDRDELNMDDVLGTGMNVTLWRDGTKGNGESSSSAGDTNSAQDLGSSDSSDNTDGGYASECTEYNGDYLGIAYLTDCEGTMSDLEKQGLYCFMRVAMQPDGTGKVYMTMDFQDDPKIALDAYFEDGTLNIGGTMMEDGSFELCSFQKYQEGYWGCMTNYSDYNGSSAAIDIIMRP